MKLYLTPDEIKRFYGLSSLSGAHARKRVILDSLGKKKKTRLSIYDIAKYEDYTEKQVIEILYNELLETTDNNKNS